ncbi:MAG TPA: hypothetical protein VF230_16235 [Acidimicrobiales bacterium]
MPDTRDLPKPTAVKNRRLKVSPGGVVTLPVAARKALGMVQGEGAKVTVAVEKEAVNVALTTDTGGFRVSRGGQLELRGEAREVLESGEARHYWIDLDDEGRRITLHPFR